jgi:hypothetical protein
MIDMASRTEPTAISPSCTEFGVSFRPQGRLLDVRLRFVCFHALFLRLVKIPKKNPFFLRMIS